MTETTFFESEQVQQNLHDIFNTYQEIASVTSMLPKMNKEEKIQHIDKCKVLIDKQKTFYTRLCLASTTDPETKGSVTPTISISKGSPSSSQVLGMHP